MQTDTSKWEVVDIDNDIVALGINDQSKTERLPVPGGWLYKVTETFGRNHTIALCFVPDASKV